MMLPPNSSFSSHLDSTQALSPCVVKLEKINVAMQQLVSNNTVDYEAYRARKRQKYIRCVKRRYSDLLKKVPQSHKNEHYQRYGAVVFMLMKLKIMQLAYIFAIQN